MNHTQALRTRTYLYGIYDHVKVKCINNGKSYYLADRKASKVVYNVINHNKLFKLGANHAR